MYVSLGCALENLLLAARAAGFGPRLTLLPDSQDDTHVARVGLAPGAREVPSLYRAIPHRHTDRSAYDTGRPVEWAALDRLASLKEESDLDITWIADEAGSGSASTRSRPP